MARILIRQSSEEVAELLRHLLEGRGHEVVITQGVTIPDGDFGVDFDLAITHIGSTPQSVQETLDFYRELQKCKVPYVIYTGASQIEVEQRTLPWPSNPGQRAVLNLFLDGAIFIAYKPDPALLDRACAILVS